MMALISSLGTLVASCDSLITSPMADSRSVLHTKICYKITGAYCAAPTCGDWDGDGDLDIIIGFLNETLLFFERSPDTVIGCNVILSRSSVLAFLATKATTVLPAVEIAILQLLTWRTCHGGMVALWDLAAHARGWRRKHVCVAGVESAMTMQRRAVETTVREFC